MTKETSGRVSNKGSLDIAAAHSSLVTQTRKEHHSADAVPRLGSGQGNLRDGGSSVWKAKWACVVSAQSKEGFCSPRILNITADFQMLFAQRTEWRTVILQAQAFTA